MDLEISLLCLHFKNESNAFLLNHLVLMVCQLLGFFDTFLWKAWCIVYQIHLLLAYIQDLQKVLMIMNNNKMVAFQMVSFYHLLFIYHHVTMNKSYASYLWNADVYSFLLLYILKYKILSIYQNNNKIKNVQSSEKIKSIRYIYAIKNL